MPRKADIGDYKKISHADFEKIQFRVGTIVDIKVHTKSKNDYILLLDCAAADEDVQVVASLRDSYNIADLLGKQVIVICNIQPEMVGREESQGMLLAASDAEVISIVSPERMMVLGTIVK